MMPLSSAVLTGSGDIAVLVLALVLFLALVAIALALVLAARNWITSRRLAALCEKSGAAHGKGRSAGGRLSVVEIVAVGDRQRYLLLVRRDNVEHLVMVGGPSDVIVESAIPVVALSSSRASGQTYAGQVSPSPAQEDQAGVARLGSPGSSGAPPTGAFGTPPDFLLPLASRGSGRQEPPPFVVGRLDESSGVPDLSARSSRPSTDASRLPPLPAQATGLPVSPPLPKGLADGQRDLPASGGRSSPSVSAPSSLPHASPSSVSLSAPAVSSVSSGENMAGTSSLRERGGGALSGASRPSLPPVTSAAPAISVRAPLAGSSGPTAGLRPSAPLSVSGDEDRSDLSTTAGARKMADEASAPDVKLTMRKASSLPPSGDHSPADILEKELAELLGRSRPKEPPAV